eukprot:4645243-Pyramimonas_sp.AAC.1
MVLPSWYPPQASLSPSILASYAKRLAFSSPHVRFLVFSAPLSFSHVTHCERLVLIAQLRIVPLLSTGGATMLR